MDLDTTSQVLTLLVVVGLVAVAWAVIETRARVRDRIRRLARRVEARETLCGRLDSGPADIHVLQHFAGLGDGRLMVAITLCGKHGEGRIISEMDGGRWCGECLRKARGL